MTNTAKALLTADARNRALRVFLQGLGYTVLSAVVMVLVPVFTNAKGWDDFDWSVIGFALLQAVVMAVLAFFMRRVLDPSGFPTPLPPTNPGPPADPPNEGGMIDRTWLIIIAVILGVIAVILLFNVRADARDTGWDCKGCKSVHGLP